MMGIKMLLGAILLVGMTFAADVDLKSYACGSKVELSGYGILKIEDPQSSVTACNWKLAAPPNFSLHLVSTHLCLSCDVDLHFKGADGKVFWDVDTVAGIQAADMSHKVCENPFIYCALAHTTSIDKEEIITLVYEKQRTGNVTVKFEYSVEKTTQPTVVKPQFKKSSVQPPRIDTYKERDEPSGTSTPSTKILLCAIAVVTGFSLI